MGSSKTVESAKNRRRVERVVRLLRERDPAALERWLAEAELLVAKLDIVLGRSRRS